MTTLRLVLAKGPSFESSSRPSLFTDVDVRIEKQLGVYQGHNGLTLCDRENLGNICRRWSCGMNQG